jgi:tRNA 2-thiouridine synthesizing protein A
MSAGAMVTVLADDPLAVVDIPHMCHGEGHAVDRVTACDGYNEFVLKVRSPATASAVLPHPVPGD